MNTTEILHRARQIFSQEATDLLQGLDEALLALETDPKNAELINSVFRPLHTLKGSSATSGMADLAAYLHRVEDVYNEAREGRILVVPEIVDLSLRICDVIRNYMSMEEEQGRDLLNKNRTLIDSLCTFLPSEKPVIAVPAMTASTEQAARKIYHVQFQPKREIFFSGVDVGVFFNDISALGPMLLRASMAELPALKELDPEQCYLSWECQVVCECKPSAIQEIFQFVEDDCQLDIQFVPYPGAWIFPNETYFDAECLADFLFESAEQLAGIEGDLLQLERGDASIAIINDLFRQLHNLKGAAQMMLSQIPFPLPSAHSLPALARLAHALEDIVESERDQTNGVSEDILQLLFEGFDSLSALSVSFAKTNPASPFPEKVEIILAERETASKQPKNSLRSNANQSTQRVFIETVSQCTLALGPLRTAIKTGGKLTSEILMLTVRTVETLQKAMHHRNIPEQRLQCLVLLLEQCEQIGSEEASETQSKGSSLRIDLTQIEALLLEVLQPSADRVMPAAPAPVKITEAASSASSMVASKMPEAKSLRVDQDKIDRLMRCVGELLVARGAFPLLAGRLNLEYKLSGVAKEVRDAGGTISRIADELQNTVMAIRMLPIRNLFQKFPRMIRDMSHTLKKEINFVTAGDATELDKTVLEQIGDPMVHLVRNALDHGIETAAERLAKGKPAIGTIRISALNQASHVVIQISDDGKGLNAEFLKKKAVEKGMITADESSKMNEQQAYQLIFAAGFSTAEKITNVSGRGVGMDVVKTNIRQLHGTIEIQTKIDAGTTFTIKLPTSLMVSKGILMKAGGQEYIIPIQCLRDMVKIPRSAIHKVGSLQATCIRGQVYSVASLARLLDIQPPPESSSSAPAQQNEEEEVPVAIVQSGESVYGLAVDRFVSEVEVIIKPLAAELADLKFFQGATIMGDGRVVLVLNPASLIPNY